MGDRHTGNIDNMCNMCHNTGSLITTGQLGMTNRMRAGEVVRIRVNPKDCLGVLDVMDMLSIPFKENMSFAQQVSIALSTLLETARAQKLLPEPDEFEFLNRMEKFRVGKHGHGKKVELTNAIGSLGSSFVAPVIAAQPTGYVEPELTAEQRRIWSRLGELQAKMELAEQEGSGIVFSASDQQEFNHLNTLV